jgi:hypothetical protein
MKVLQLRLPERVHGRARRLAHEEGLSLNQFLVTSVSNEIVRQETNEFFKRAASKFDPSAFNEALAAVPDLPAMRADRIRPRARVRSA